MTLPPLLSVYLGDGTVALRVRNVKSPGDVGVAVSGHDHPVAQHQGAVGQQRDAPGPVLEFQLFEGRERNCMTREKHNATQRCSLLAIPGDVERHRRHPLNVHRTFKGR